MVQKKSEKQFKTSTEKSLEDIWKTSWRRMVNSHGILQTWLKSWIWQPKLKIEDNAYAKFWEGGGVWLTVRTSGKILARPLVTNKVGRPKSYLVKRVFSFSFQFSLYLPLFFASKIYRDKRSWEQVGMKRIKYGWQKLRINWLYSGWKSAIFSEGRVKEIYTASVQL